ncbi:hypothetical protein WH47_10550, partial [Habropoda laboriosa]
LDLIREQIETHVTRISREQFIFQQDNAAVHTAKVVQTYFKTNNIPLLKWPARYKYNRKLLGCMLKADNSTAQMNLKNAFY